MRIPTAHGQYVLAARKTVRMDALGSAFLSEDYLGTTRIRPEQTAFSLIF
jgi:hypothetical protein